uniref:Uncharacterized protein n=1 Tax=Oryza brachyantha TaxID=4533 RepID=J3MSZ6_ORYBR
MAPPPRHHLVLLLLLVVVPILASAGLVLEDGYAVTTVADLNPVPNAPHPYALLPRPRAGDLVLLDSAGFTTTIAGGRSKGSGHKDGPAQNATFSPDFELVYVPKLCALLVTDRGNRMIRQINLKQEDCPRETQPGFATTSVSIIAVVCALFGSVIGFLVWHVYPAHEVSINRFFSQMRKQYKRIQRGAALISCSDIKSVVANSVVHALLLKLVRVSVGYLSVVFPSVRSERRVPAKPCPSLIDLDNNITTSVGLDNKAHESTELAGNFIGFDGDTSSEEDNEPAADVCGRIHNDKDPAGDLAALLDSPQVSSMKIDDMIEANLSDFSGQENYNSSAVKCSGISRRRLHGDSKAV